MTGGGMEIEMPFFGCLGVLAGVLVMGWFIYRKQLWKEIDEKNRSIEALNVLQLQQDFFIRKMIHEMNTPLSAIELNVSVLLRESPLVKNIEMIRGSARILSTIYDDIAYMCRKESLIHPVESIELESFIADRVLYFDAMTSVKELLIDMEIAEGSRVLMSRTELQRVVDNTLSNAIKYTHSLGESIHIMVIRNEDGGIDLVFQDHGIGMSEDEKQKLFETYYHGNAHHMGLGLGMSIVRDICDHYGIVIEIESSRGKGSLFTYRFPAELNASVSIQH
jgi:signal transduction histidine kinase